MVYSMLTLSGRPIDMAAMRGRSSPRSPFGRTRLSALKTRRTTSNGSRQPRRPSTGNFWDRYRRYLEDIKLMPRQVVWRLDEYHRQGPRAT